MSSKSAQSGAERSFELASVLEYERKRFKDAAFHYEKAIAENHPLAQFNYALWYLEGNRPGVPKNLVKARQLFELSASQGVGAAMVNLAQMYEKGSAGLKKNEKEAFRLYRKSVQDERKGFNFAKAYLHIGYMYLEGRGTAKDIPRAVKWFERAKAAGEDIPDEIIGMIRMLSQLQTAGKSQQKESDVRWNRMVEDIDARSDNDKPHTYKGWQDVLSKYGFGIEKKAVEELAHRRCNFGEFMELSGGQMFLLDCYETQDAPLARQRCGFCDFKEEEGIKMKKCARCGQPYCSKPCQKKDWKDHKKVCNVIASGELPSER